MPQLDEGIIPNFPLFKSISVDDRDVLEKYISCFPPYSDFNFMSLLTWNTDDCILVSQLFGNLVIKFDDYISRKTYFSFLGTNDTVKACSYLIRESRNIGIATELKLVPEDSVNSREFRTAFEVLEDRDDFDYVFDVQEMANLSGGRVGSKRNFINRFKNSYTFSYEVIDLDSPEMQVPILSLTKTWKVNKGSEALSTKFEFLAIQNAIMYAKKLNILTVGLFVEDKLIGISINNLLPDGFAMNLFEKADSKFIGSFPFLRHITCKYLLDYNRSLLNFESDIGVSGLRQSKLSYHPKYFLKKYIVRELEK